MLRVLIVDDHAIVRKGVMGILQDSWDTEIACDEAALAHEAQTKIAANQYDLVLLDISMPGENGLELLKRLHQEYPELPVLILSMHPEEQYAIRALTLGAAGYLTKESAPDELVDAVKRVLSGRRYISMAVAEKMAASLESGKPMDLSSHDLLSEREFQVLRLMALGKTTTQIAGELFISIKTVSTYRLRLMKKMNLNNNAEILTYAFRNGLIQEAL